MQYERAKKFSPNFSFHDSYEQFAKFFARQISRYTVVKGKVNTLNMKSFWDTMKFQAKSDISHIKD